MTNEGAGSTFRMCIDTAEILGAGRPVVRVAALEEVAGTLLHLTGENGAGKTTLLRALTGEAAYRGQIHLGSAVPGTVAAKAVTAYVPTDATLLDDLTVAENMTFMARGWGKDEEKVFVLAERFGLRSWWDAWPMELSRGTRQKVALSIGLGLELPLTLLDEPFGTLDTFSRVVLLEALRGRVASGGLVIVTTHGDELAGEQRKVLQIREGVLVPA